MKKTLFLFIILNIAQSVKSQSADEIIQQVLASQQHIQTLAYTLQRSDTFVTGDVRITSGIVKMKAMPSDTVFGCWFWSKRDDVNAETIYDGRGMQISHNNKSYNPSVYLPGLLGSAGGQMVVPHFVRLDTAGNTGFTLKQDGQFYYLTKHLPDIKEHDVTNRYTIFTIDKKKMLPVGMRSHQETLGKVQDLNYTIKEMWVNDEAHAFDFSAARFGDGYQQEQASDYGKKFRALQGKEAPLFELASFKAGQTALKALKGKPVLLDFWEVWCGPCVASMPKVQALYDKYHAQGLQVYGIMSEEKQLAPARLLLEKKNIRFPMLLGNDAIKNDYGVEGVPAYVLIDKEGKIAFVSLGFSEEMEKEIAKVAGVEGVRNKE
ncbi:MAG: TlpA family protein disulfide reductase [Agriterribacter sp.]